MAEDLEQLHRKLREQEAELFNLRNQLSEVTTHAAIVHGHLALPKSKSGTNLSGEETPVASRPASRKGTLKFTAVGKAVSSRHEDKDSDEDCPAIDRMFTSAHAQPRRSSADLHLREAEDIHEMLRERIQYLEEQLEERDRMMMSESSPMHADPTCSGPLMGRRGTVRDWKNVAHAKDAELLSLQQDIADLERVIAEQDHECAELKRHNEELESRCKDQAVAVATLKKEGSIAREHLEKANARYTEIWRKAEEQRRELAEAKEVLKVRDLELAQERDMRHTDLTSRMRSRKSSVHESLLHQLVPASECGDDDGRLEEEVEMLRDELEQANELLAEALQAREEFVKVEQCLREELGRASRKLEEQVKVTETIADSERKLRSQLTDVTSRSSMRGSNKDAEARLLRVQVASAEAELKEALESRDDEAEAEGQVQSELFASASQLQQELEHQDDLLQAEQALREQVLEAQVQLRDRLAQVPECASDAEAAALRQKLEGLEGELRESLDSLHDLLDGERHLREQLAAHAQQLKEQFVERSRFFKTEEELREQLSACKERLRDRDAGPDSLLPNEQIIKLLQEHLQDAERGLDDTSTTQKTLKQSDAQVREQLEVCSRTVEQRLSVREAFADREKYLAELLASANAKLAAQVPEGAAAKQELLQELQLQLAQAQAQLQDTEATREQLSRSEGELRAQVKWSEDKLQQQDRLAGRLEGIESALREDLAKTRKRLKGPGAEEDSDDDDELRNKLGRVERQLTELLAQKDQYGQTEAHLRARLASAHLQLKEQDVNVPVVSLRIPSGFGGGPDEAGGGVPAEDRMGRTKTSDERLRMRRELAIIRAELRGVAEAMLDDVEADREVQGEPSWMDVWMGSAKRIVCCRPDADKASSSSSNPSDRRRQLLMRLREHLRDPEPEAEEFDPTSFESTD